MNAGDVLARLRAPGAWRLLALPALTAAVLLVGRLLGALSARLARRLALGTASAWDDALASRLSGPLTLIWAAALGHLAAPLLELGPTGARLVGRGLGITLILGAFWLLLRAVDIAGQIAGGSRWAASALTSRALLGLATRALKAAVIVGAGAAVLAQAGYAVTSLLAGLGLGGLALALAAQKTVENVFGAFSLAVDAPFNQGDFVRLEDVVGTVETIGLRSTRIRTLDRTIVAIPNGKLAEMRVESFSARDRIRLACTIGLVYRTTAAQMRNVLAGIEAVLRGHPLIWPDAVVVRFKELGAFSLDIDVMAWFQTPDWGQFQVIRQELLLSFMEVVEREGTAFAFPTRTVHVVAEPPDGQARGAVS